MAEDTSMKERHYRATRMVHGIYGPLVQEMHTDNGRVLNDQAIETYLKEHRNNPAARQKFVAEHYLAGHIDKALSPLHAEREYIETMEAALRQKGVGDGTQQG